MAVRKFGVRVPMRDGVGLATDLHFPDSGPEGGPYPVLLMRTPYTRQRWWRTSALYTAAGYAVAIQDVRGRGESDGEWRPLWNEGRDGHDAIEWIAEQTWCTGAVGTYGGSYPGFVQFQAARERPPHLRAMTVAVPAGRFGEQEMFDHGVMFLGCLAWSVLTSGRILQFTSAIDWERVFRHLPLRDMPDVIGMDVPEWETWFDHAELDEYWQALRLSDHDFAATDVPVLHIGGWYDSNLAGSLFYYQGMRTLSPARDHQALVIGPWDHEGAGSDAPPATLGPHAFPDESAIDLGAIRLSWFDHWLKDQGEAAEGAQTYVTQAGGWRVRNEWPPVTEPLCFYLDGEMLSDSPATSNGLRVYAYDPADPVVRLSNWDFYGFATEPMVEQLRPPIDESAWQSRPDVLIFTGAPLERSVDIEGEPTLVIFAESDGPDTDWFCWLLDIDEDESMQISDGRLRARFRESLSSEKLLQPGEVYEYRIPMRSFAHRLAAGHRLRLCLSSSDFPVYDRNLNTGEPIGKSTRMRIARNTIHFGPATMSRIELPQVRLGES